MAKMNDAGLQNGLSDQEDIYQRFLLTISRLTGADGVSLLLSIIPSTPLLVHLVNSDPLSSFATTEAASTAITTALAQAKPPGQSLIQPYSIAGNGTLLRIAVGEISGQELRADPLPTGVDRRKVIAPGGGQAVWLALRYDSEDIPALVSELSDPGTTAPNTASQWLADTLLLGASTLWQASHFSFLLRDPTSQLPGRAEFQTRLKSLFAVAQHSSSTLGLLLVNPDDFGLINQRLDREGGDQALAEIAQMLRECLRRSDLLFRYGGAVFAVLLPQADSARVDAVARKIRQALSGPYLDGAFRLTFSVGTVVYQPGAKQETNIDDLGLLRRADHALNLAKRAGGGCVVMWDADESEMQGVGQDRLSGIFTADTEKDYRNMLMLWDTIAVLSSAEQRQEIAANFVERINLALKPSRAAVIIPDAEHGHQVLALAAGPVGAAEPTMVLTAEQIKLLEEVQQLRSTERVHFEHTKPGSSRLLPFLAYAVPLRAGERYLGALYIDGPEESLVLDSSDLVFLDALSGQVGLALDRADLTSRWKEETESESRRLRKEVQELRQVVHSARMVYSSQAMQTVLDTLRAVAPTDVTILITGESGTGKELLARSVHEMSNRKEQPLVTVDCGAIAHSLMEAELFGRVKGAYTGADSASPGRIVQADGGTLFLDEVGEIPLDVQAKLLRFVQEKEISPVGASDSIFVNVRIVAATNRDLEKEVAGGRFREDLFYRLKVVTVTSPPLRERREDIVPLSTYFLEKFALQYDKGVGHFSPEAEHALQIYDWPGNVRELQNSILRAVVLSEGEVLGRELLEFDSAAAPAGLAPPPGQGLTPTTPADPLTRDSAPSSDPWAALEQGFHAQVRVALAGPDSKPVPLGRWLTEDLVLAADQHASGVSRRAAALLGVAETTYRRQLEAVQSAQSHALLTRTPVWAELQPLVTRLVSTLGDSAGENILQRARLGLLESVKAQVGGDDRAGSALMGITMPTYRRWLTGLDTGITV